MWRSLGIFVLGFCAGGGALWLFSQKSTAEKSNPRTVNLYVADGGIYRVRKVIDGDTVVLENGIHVRYNGINAPETGHFVHDIMPMGAEATKRNIELVEGKQVRLRLAEEPLDIHGRVIAHVLILPETSGNGTATEEDAGAILVKEGLARAMYLGIRAAEYKRFKDLENEAREKKIGIWSLEDLLRAQGMKKPYCASSSLKIYHLATCPIAKRIHAANLYQYSSMDEAEAAGLNPCSKCIPK